MSSSRSKIKDRKSKRTDDKTIPLLSAAEPSSEMTSMSSSSSSSSSASEGARQASGDAQINIPASLSNNPIDSISDLETEIQENFTKEKRFTGNVSNWKKIWLDPSKINWGGLLAASIDYGVRYFQVKADYPAGAPDDYLNTATVSGGAAMITLRDMAPFLLLYYTIYTFFIKHGELKGEVKESIAKTSREERQFQLAKLYNANLQNKWADLEKSHQRDIAFLQGQIDQLREGAKESKDEHEAVSTIDIMHGLHAGPGYTGHHIDKQSEATPSSMATSSSIPEHAPTSPGHGDLSLSPPNKHKPRQQPASESSPQMTKDLQMVKSTVKNVFEAKHDRHLHDQQLMDNAIRKHKTTLSAKQSGLITLAVAHYRLPNNELLFQTLPKALVAIAGISREPTDEDMQAGFRLLIAAKLTLNLSLEDAATYLNSQDGSFKKADLGEDAINGEQVKPELAEQLTRTYQESKAAQRPAMK